MKIYQLNVVQRQHSSSFLYCHGLAVSSHIVSFSDDNNRVLQPEIELKLS